MGTSNSEWKYFLEFQIFWQAEEEVTMREKMEFTWNVEILHPL